MNLQAVVEDLVATADPRRAAILFKEHRGTQGLNASYFQETVRAFGTDPEAAKRLSARHQLMLRYGDEPAYAHRTRGIHERLRGRWLLSAKAFQEAGKAAGDPLEKLTFQFGAVDSLARAGKTDEAVVLGRRLYRQLRKLGEEVQAARLSINVANALLWVDRYREARKWLTAAVPVLEEAEFSTEANMAKLSLSTTELYGGTPQAALDLAEAVLEFANQEELEFLGLQASLNKAHALLLTGKADEALSLLLHINSQSKASESDLARIQEFLGDVYLRLNLFDEARDAYWEALQRKDFLPKPNIAASYLGLGQSCYHDGLYEESWLHLDRGRRLFERAKNYVWAAACQLWIARTAVAMGRPGAEANARAALTKAKAGFSPYFVIDSTLTLCEIRGQSADLPRLKNQVSKYGYMGFEWKILALEAKLAERGKLGKYRKAFNGIISHRALTSSTVSRVNYFQDKQDVLSTYVQLLVESGKSEHVSEAIEAISLSRSAALCDEIISSRAISLSEQQLADLNTLRAELSSVESVGPTSDYRYAPMGQERIRALQRRWIEIVHRVLTPSGQIGTRNSDAKILYQGEHSLHLLHMEGAKTLGLNVEQLREQLGWLKFELLAPMTHRRADPQPCLEEIRRLGKDLDSDALAHSRLETIIAPDGVLWEVPWTALHEDSEVVLALHPRLTHVLDKPIIDPSKVMLWVADSADLEKSSQEANEFLRHYPGAHVCRTAAEVRASFSREVDLLHVISHASLSSRNPMFSAFQFSDGLIFGTEIAESSLKVVFATLSACETGSLSTSVRHEPDGLARALLARGAKTVIGSLWPLDDEAAAMLFTHFYRCLNSGDSVQQSLRSARNVTRGKLPHPYFWASPVLFAGYST